MVQTATQSRELSPVECAVIGHLVVEALAGEIKPHTREAISKLGDPTLIPAPYNHLVGYTQGYRLNNRELAHDLQDELRIICVELLDPDHA